jgi:hypothetical protein
MSPGQRVGQVGEQLVGTGEPRVGVIDPGELIEPGSLDPSIEHGRYSLPEDARLIRQHPHIIANRCSVSQNAWDHRGSGTTVRP